MSLNQPQYLNELRNNSFKVTFERIKTASYFCQEVTIPGLSLGTITQSNKFSDIYLPGVNITFDPFQMNFLVDEGLENWMEIKKWMCEIAPTGNDKEGTSIKKFSDVYSSCVVTVLSNNKNPLRTFYFKDVYPINLSGFVFSSQGNAEAISAIASFRFTLFEIEKHTL